MLHCSFSAVKTLSTQGFLKNKSEVRYNPTPNKYAPQTTPCSGGFSPKTADKRLRRATAPQPKKPPRVAKFAPFPPWKHKTEYRRQLPPLYSPLGRVRASHSTGHGKAASCLLQLGGRKPCTHLLSLKRKGKQRNFKTKRSTAY